MLIVTDDERADTPRLANVTRRLARRGVTFSNAFVTTSMCCPARAGILTGQYSHHNGVVGNGGRGAYLAFDEQSTLAVWLRGAGYATALVGKYLNGYSVDGHDEVPPGWSDWQAIDSAPAQRYYDYVLDENGREVFYGSAPSDYSTSVLARKAVEFLRGAREPFFLYFAPVAPHLPATPAPGDARSVPAPPLPAPSFNERDVRDKPWARLHPRRLSRNAVRYLLDTIRDKQLESLRAVDRSVGEIATTLGRRHLLDRTVILYTSDNGFLWGEHRLGGKVWPYDESIRVPLVARVPWPQAWDTTDDHLVLNIDLASTVAELAGVRPGLPQDGRSLVPLLRDESVAWRSAFLVEYRGRSLLGQGGPPPFRAIRTQRYLDVDYDNGWRELYDLARDPWELRNVAADPRYALARSLLERRLTTLSRRRPRSP